MNRSRGRRILLGILLCFAFVNGARAQSEEAPAPEAPTEPAPVAPPALTPPRVLESKPPIYPATHLSHAEHPSVVLKVTVLPDGSVTDLQIEHSAGADFDQAALEAVRTWKFEPARRDGAPIASRVGVSVHFELPELGSVSVTAIEGAEAPVPHDHEAHAEEPHADEERDYGASAEVERTKLRPGTRGASDFELSGKVLEAAPRREGADLLTSAPGMFVARAEGDAVAHGIMVRGFDAEHGQDLELRVGGLPLNLPSHIHGQGYADLGFLIGEVVHEVRVVEGVYDPRQGDFAVAGSIDFDLGVAQRGVRARSTYGSFGTFRQLVLWAPEAEDRDTFAAGQYKRTDGFGDNRDGQSGSAIAQFGKSSGAFRYRVLGIVHGARANMAGVVRRDDVSQGRVDYDGVYAYPTAQKQSASASRVMLGAMAEYRGADGDNADFGLWLGHDDFRIQENFTGFVQRSRTLENTSGRGDLIEQLNRTNSLGLWARYRTAPYRPFSFLQGQIEAGVTGRLDEIEQAQNLLDATVRNQTWDERVDADVRALDLGMFADLDGRVFDILRLRAGMRADLLSYAIDDRLGNFAPLTRPQDTYIVGFRRSAQGVAFGPRTSADLTLPAELHVLAAYGEGYRSPQARMLDDGERAPFTKVRSADFGLRWGAAHIVSLESALFWTHLSDDVAFDASEGRLERVGATRRLGGTFAARSEPVSWLFASASVTYVDAELLEPPPPTAEQPQPAFRKGQNLPFVPPVVARADLGAVGTLLPGLGRHDLTGRAGLGYSFLSRRPLPYGARAATVSLLDGSLGASWGPLTVAFEAFNLLDTRYAAAEYNFVSNWDPDSAPSRTPARHIAAGAPRTLLGSVEVRL